MSKFDVKQWVADIREDLEDVEPGYELRSITISAVAARAVVEALERADRSRVQPDPEVWAECSECGMAWILRRLAQFHEGEIRMVWAWQRDCRHSEVKPRMHNALAAAPSEPRPSTKVSRAAGPAEISTRRIHNGTVHEMADLGVGTMCERDLPEPWTYTDAPVNCDQCLARLTGQRRRLRAALRRIPGEDPSA